MAHHNAKDVTRREAYLVSQLSSLDAWKGKLVHLALERYFVSSLQQGNLISCEDLIQKTLVLGRQQLEFARQRKYRETGITKTRVGDKYLALKIHEAEDNFWTDKIDKVFDEVRQCYQNLYNYHELIDFLTNKADWCETEFRLSFKLNGVNIVGEPDLLVGYGDRTLDSSYNGGNPAKDCLAKYV